MIPKRAPLDAASPVPVFIAVRHNSVREALWRLLEAEPGVEPLAATADLADTVRLLGTLAPAVVVLDESVLGDGGLRKLPTVAAAAPRTAFVVVGMHDHPRYVTWAREVGAADYVLLDEAAERLGRSVVEAAEPSAPLRASRRRAGSRAVSVVPAPDADSIISLPPSNSTRSRIPTSPKPPAVPDASNP
jgi:DNA-binding NarL/FixJ family response regulator